MNDAVNVDSDNAIARLKEDMRSHKINYADITKPDPVDHPETIVVKGVPPEQTSDFKNIVTDRLPDYEASSGAENSWTVSMKPQSLADLKNRAVAQAIETIRNRIDALGVSEPVIQEHGLGQYQILVQLPGVDDPARVKEIMQSTAMLEIKQSLGGPYSSEEAALQDKGGVLPPDAVLMPGQEHRRAGQRKRRKLVLDFARVGGDRDAICVRPKRAATKMASRRCVLFLPAKVAASSIRSLPRTWAITWRWFSITKCRKWR